MSIYLAMADRYGIGQAQVDEMELWVIAGLVDPDGTAADPEAGGMMTPEEFADESKRLLIARVAAAERDRASTIPPVNPADVS